MTSAPRVPEDRVRSGGFTLVELLMAISITGIILVTLGFAVTEGYRNASDSKTSIDRSILGDYAARYFAADVASTTFGPGAIVTTTPTACGTGTPIIDIQTGAGTVVSYAVLTETTGAKSLVRTMCSGALSGPLIQTARQHIGTTDASLAVSASCATATSCGLSLSWTAPNFSIGLTGTRWVNATTTTTAPTP